jgi:hypothetical protein
MTWVFHCVYATPLPISRHIDIDTNILWPNARDATNISKGIPKRDYRKRQGPLRVEHSFFMFAGKRGETAGPLGQNGESADRV